MRIDNPIVTGSLQVNGPAHIIGKTHITGSISVTSNVTALSFTGSLFGLATSASYAINAATASYALNAGTTINTGSFLTTSSFNAYTSSNISQFAGTSSFAVTASYVENAQTASYTIQATSASYVNPLYQNVQITGSLDVSQGNIGLRDNAYFLQGTDTGGGNILLIGVNTSDQIYIGNQGITNILADNTIISGSLIVTNGITGSLHGTASWAENSVTASYVETAQTASYTIQATSASYVNPLYQNVQITGSVNITGSISNVEYIDYKITSNPAHLEGRIHWTDDTKTLSVDTDVNNFMLELGHQNVLRFRNTTGTTLPAGTIVYINGQSGNRPTVATASWVGDATSAATLGFVAQAVNDAQTGYVVTNGILRGIDTNAYAPGTKLYLSSSGRFTSTPPDAPLHEVRLGKVITQATAGTIYVNIMNGYELDELHDLKVTNPLNGDLLIYSQSLWTKSKNLSGSYSINGGLTVNGEMVVNAALELTPSEDPGVSNITSSFLFVSRSADNTENNLQYRNNGALWETHWLEEQTSTGLSWGGALRFSGTTMFIKPGAGLIINHNPSTGSHGDTIPTYIQFGPITASATFITSSQLTYLLIDENGSLIQQTTPFTPQQYVEKFPLGYITHLVTSSISAYADARVTTYAQNEQQNQFIRAFGPLKLNGFDLSPQPGSLRLTIASGRTFRAGGFYIQNPDNPSVYDSTTVATASFVRLFRDPTAVGGFKAMVSSSGLPYKVIDPTKWDNGTGTLLTVSSSQWTVQRIYQGAINNISYIYYGQKVYDTFLNALSGLSTDDFVESSATQIALPFIGYVLVKGDTTNLSDSVNNRLINSGLFRNTAGSSGGGGITTTNLNDLSDVTLSSLVTGQALVYNAGIWTNGVPLNSTNAVTAATASFVTSSAVRGPFGFNSIRSASFATKAVTASFAPSQTWSVRTVSGLASTASLNNFILVSASRHTVTLPQASANAKVAVKWIVNPTTASIKTPGAGVTIDGTNRSVTGLGVYNQWDAYSFISDGTNWFIMS